VATGAETFFAAHRTFAAAAQLLFVAAPIGFRIRVMAGGATGAVFFSARFAAEFSDAQRFYS
jgi:hypothetical protein